MDIVGVGTVAMDTIIQVETLPGDDSVVYIQRRSHSEGGSAANVLVQASRLGATCGLVAQVGNDHAGTTLQQGLRREGVDTRYMTTRPGGTSLSATVVVARNGARFIIVDKGDTFHTLDHTAAIDYIRDAKVFYTDLLPGNAAIPALHEASRASVTTVFNMQVSMPAMRSAGVDEDDIHEVLADVDVFAPCREAVLQLTAATTYAAGIEALGERFGGLILLTLGSEGSLSWRSGQLHHVPAREVVVVDTTGAGDSYVGAFIHAYLLQNMDLNKAMQLATVCASLTCTRLGARTSPTLEVVRKHFPAP